MSLMSVCLFLSGNGAVSKLQPDQPMPPEAELNTMFAELVDELDLDRPHREAMFQLPPEKKWQIYCSNRRETDDENINHNNPEYYIDAINSMSSNKGLSYRDEEGGDGRQSMVDSLKTALRTLPMRWVRLAFLPSSIPLVVIACLISQNFREAVSL